MKKPKFDKLLPLLRSNEDFSLTESQYEEKTGAPLPKETYYLKQRSAFSNIAKEHGFTITVHERTVIVKKSNKSHSA